MHEKKNVVPIEALFGEAPMPSLPADPRDDLADADVVVAVDVMSQREVLVYGRETLQGVVDRGAARSLQVMYIGLDLDTDELKRLCDLVRIVKGRCDYQPGTGGA
jgi:hypothetical protein